MYLISDIYEPSYSVAPYAGGILGVVAETGVPVAGYQIKYSMYATDSTSCDLANTVAGAGSCRNEELEGVTFWDLDDGRAPGVRGNLHVMLVDNFPSRSYWYKHYRIAH